MTDTTKAVEWLKELPDTQRHRARVVVEVEFETNGEGTVTGVKTFVSGHGGADPLLMSLVMLSLKLGEISRAADGSPDESPSSPLAEFVRNSSNSAIMLMRSANLAVKEIPTDSEEKKKDRMDFIIDED